MWSGIFNIGSKVTWPSTLVRHTIINVLKLLGPSTQICTVVAGLPKGMWGASSKHPYIFLGPSTQLSLGDWPLWMAYLDSAVFALTLLIRQREWRIYLFVDNVFLGGTKTSSKLSEQPLTTEYFEKGHSGKIKIPMHSNRYGVGGRNYY